jgi:glutathione-regulated potassium-efflux system ancillary protein KefF
VTVICVVHAHPYIRRSRANRALADALRGMPGLDLRSLYDLYPDFDIDVAAEQQALARARLVVWMHPVYWYSVPALLKHWFEKVLALGWAYGEGGTALSGKHCLWVATAGGDERAYTPSGMHAHPFSSFVPVIEQTARFCGMQWEPPYIVHGADSLDDARLARHAAAVAQWLSSWREPEASPNAEAPR